MTNILFTQVGFWSAFTIVFIFGFMGYLFWKLMKLSKEDQQRHNASH